MVVPIIEWLIRVLQQVGPLIQRLLKSHSGRESMVLSVDTGQYAMEYRARVQTIDNPTSDCPLERDFRGRLRIPHAAAPGVPGRRRQCQ